MHNRLKLLIILFACVLLSGCTKETPKSDTLIIAAAASLKECLEQKIEPLFEQEHPDINLVFTFDGSGKLQTQIQEGADVDIFFSAATKNMDELIAQGLINQTSVVPLLKNEIVLITTKEDPSIQAFSDIVNANQIALGDPDSVPAGQYAKEALTNLNLWTEVEKKTSFGTNVTEVLNWVAEGSADAGIVYSTDAKSNSHVHVVEACPSNLVSPIIYPIGITTNSEQTDHAKLLITFLQTKEADEIFQSYGFRVN